MAFSPASPLGLISQLTQGSRRDNFAASPSPRRAFEEDLNLTVSSFQPDIESTQQFDTATQDNFMDHRNEVPAQPADFGDDSMSIEIARGLKGSARDSPYKNAFDDEVSENPIISLGDSLYEVTGTPPMKNTTSRKYSDMRPDSLRKQASVRRASAMPQLEELTKTSDIVLPKQRSTSAANKRTLSNVHAKVNEEGNSTIIEDTRQLKEKSSRFAKSRMASGDLKSFPTRFATQDGLEGASRSNTSRRATSAPDPAFTGNQTAQSFMLPNLPEINELVSGVRKDGTPLFTKSAKAKSRFSSASYARGANQDMTQHAVVQAITLPEDEKAIFTSLQLLQTKVADLEHEKNEVSRKLENYANAVITLKAQLQAERRLRRPDSGLGMDDETSTKEKWRAEKSNLKATARATQERLERSERKLSVSEIALKRITQERENVVTQLGVAFYNNEELKDENERLQKENEELHQIQRHAHQAIESMQVKNEKWQVKYTTLQNDAKEAAVASSRRESELKQQLAERDQQRPLKTSSRTANETSKSQTKATESADQTAAREQRRRSKGAIDQAAVSDILDRFEEGIRKVRAEAAGQTTGTLSRSASEASVEKKLTRTLARSDSTRLQRHASTENALKATTDPISEAISIAAAAIGQSQEDITSLSFLDPDNVSNLRKQLEEERLARRLSRRSSKEALAARSSSKGDDTERPETFVDPKSGRTRVRIRSPRSADAISYDEPDGTTDMSMLSNCSRRPQVSAAEEMTSGFILPDITLRNTDMRVPHEKANCTYCPDEVNKQPVSIPKPTPVTERDIDETDMTMRPSQPPAEALATVLKQLEDEVTHLKLKLTSYEKVYSSHDPAMGRRTRKRVKAKIDSLLAEIERRSEQIYALYDVLEGQRGQSAAKDIESMDQEEVEETLQGLGIDAAELAQKANKHNKKTERKTMKTGYETLDDILNYASDDSSRWEGFSSGESDNDSTS